MKALALLCALSAGFLTSLFSRADEPDADLPGGVRHIVFAMRQPGNDVHWYANFGHYAQDPSRKAYGKLGRLGIVDLETGEVDILVDDLEGTVRDPQVHYSGERILFSYRKSGTEHFHLYEINVDGTGLRQITDGPQDDIEPAYLPDGGLVFCSSRCNRFVGCWHTPVAILYRCDADGGNVVPLSANTEHDNTPWPMPDGRVLYMRWEYIDRSQVHYHHLWTMNPDGTGQMVYFGNMHPGGLLIDAKPIPGTAEVLTIHSRNHGRREHAGSVGIISPKKGPDDLGSMELISDGEDFRDPYPLSRDLFLAVRGKRIFLMKRDGSMKELYVLPDEFSGQGAQIHEPRPIRPRKRERVIPPSAGMAKATGTLVLANVNEGRRMDGVEQGSIKKLLVLEALPVPVHYHGGMRPITYGGSFMLERVLGTVPVESDGSAHMELPALRCLFFVALDENDLSVKRMQSFLTVMPGETFSCVGCHEPRTQAPRNPDRSALKALQRTPSRIQPIDGIPEVFDFPRDIQPVLDKHCVPCHGVEKREAGVNLDGGRGPMYTHSYYTLTWRGQIADGRNKPESNLPPRKIGAVASPLMKKVLNHHNGVELTRRETDLIRYWLEAGATYPGTYAAYDSGMIGHTLAPKERDRSDLEWDSAGPARDALKRRCMPCHDQKPLHMARFMSDGRGWGRFSTHSIFNLTEPASSMVLLAPLAKGADGKELCKEKDDKGKWTVPLAVFENKEDADYQKILRYCQDGKAHLERITRFDMARFIPPPAYVREMKRYGVLSGDFQQGTPLNPYETDDKYWRASWWPPEQ